LERNTHGADQRIGTHSCFPGLYRQGSGTAGSAALHTRQEERMGTFSRRLRCTAAAILCLAARQACAAGGDFLDAIEYYYPSLDHYFVTANPSEIAALDGGTFPGWQRTSLGFKVYDPATAIPGLVPVCRFYG